MPTHIHAPASPDSSSRSFFRISLFAGVLIALGVSAAIATQWMILGSFEGRWVYGYGKAFTPQPIVAAGVASLAAAALIFASMRAASRAWLVLPLWLAAGLAFQGLLRSVTPATLDTIVVSDAASSFYSVARDHPADDILDRYARIRAQAPLHAQSNMPGKVLLVKLLQQLTPRADVIAWLIVALSTVGAVPMYFFVRGLGAGDRVALVAAIFYLFTPARVIFLPLMNTITPVLVLGCAVLLLGWLRTGRTILAVLSGVALYGLTFFEPLPLVIGLLFAALSLRAIAAGGLHWERFAFQTAAMVIAFVACSEAMNLAFGFELITTFRQIARHAAEFNATEVRPYGLWIFTNLEEFFFATGPAQAVLFGAVMVASLRAPLPWRERLAGPMATVALGLTAVLLATDLLGINRGEVTRLWIFIACFWQIPAAYACASLGAAATSTIVAVSCLQIALGTSMIRFIVP